MTNINKYLLKQKTKKKEKQKQQQQQNTTINNVKHHRNVTATIKTFNKKKIIKITVTVTVTMSPFDAVLNCFCHLCHLPCRRWEYILVLLYSFIINYFFSLFV